MDRTKPDKVRSKTHINPPQIRVNSSQIRVNLTEPAQTRQTRVNSASKTRISMVLTSLKALNHK
jgi:hypothetical protein